MTDTGLDQLAVGWASFPRPYGDSLTSKGVANLHSALTHCEVAWSGGMTTGWEVRQNLAGHGRHLDSDIFRGTPPPALKL